jgi:LacI family transcriptional regulator
MNPTHTAQEPWRIAVLWRQSVMDMQHCQGGMYRHADLRNDVWIRKFDADTSDFKRDVLGPLRQWRPHGVIVRMWNWDRLGQVRREFPTLPVVATVMTPPELADTVVAASSTELIEKARDHFLKNGLAHIGLFTIAEERFVAKYTALFREIVPAGLELVCPGELIQEETPASRKRVARLMTGGLRALPKPIGMLTLEPEASIFLLEWCRFMKIKVPGDVQIIGVGEDDYCMSSQPHLTGLALPHERIGETALDTLLRHLRGELPSLPPLLRVPGSRVIPRGTTALVSVGRKPVSDAIDRLRERAVKGVTATLLARISKVSRSTLYRQFAATAGVTPARLLRQQRLDEACRMLRETDAPVVQIARACGFKTLSDFANFFRRQTGGTPTDYREKQRGGAEE